MPQDSLKKLEFLRVLEKKHQIVWWFPEKAVILHRFLENGDPLAQLVEHNTFNVGVLGSSPKRITPSYPRGAVA